MLKADLKLMNETWWNWYFFSKTNSNFTTDHQFALLVICILNVFFFWQIIETDAFLKIFAHNFERTPVFIGFLIMQTFMKIPLATVLCGLLLLLLTTLCSANDNNSSKPSDKVSLFNQTMWYIAVEVSQWCLNY